MDASGLERTDAHPPRDPGAAGGLALALAKPRPVRAQSFARVRGAEFVGADGLPLKLKGINLGNWLVPEGYFFGFNENANSPRDIEQVAAELLGPDDARAFWDAYRDVFVAREDIALIARLGFNLARVPLDHRLFLVDAAPGPVDGPGFALLDRLVGWCRAEGLFVVPDLHCAPGGQTGTNIDNSLAYPFLLKSERSQARAQLFWERMAERYAGEPAILGFDLLNEPVANFLSYDVPDLQSRLTILYRRLAQAVRRHDPNRILFMTDRAALRGLRDPNVALTFHLYWTPDVGENWISEPLKFREETGLPLWMGESGENTPQWVAQFRGLLERHDIGWCFWPYKKLFDERAVVTADPPKSWPTIAAYARTPRPSMWAVLKSRPNLDVAASIWSELLAGLQLSRCVLNTGFVDALGLDGGGAAHQLVREVR